MLSSSPAVEKAAHPASSMTLASTSDPRRPSAHLAVDLWQHPSTAVPNRHDVPELSRARVKMKLGRRPSGDNDGSGDAVQVAVQKWFDLSNEHPPSTCAQDSKCRRRSGICCVVADFLWQAIFLIFSPDAIPMTPSIMVP